MLELLEGPVDGVVGGFHPAYAAGAEVIVEGLGGPAVLAEAAGLKESSGPPVRAVCVAEDLGGQNRWVISAGARLGCPIRSGPV